MNEASMPSFANATVTVNLPCQMCQGTGVVEVGPEGTMKTKTCCSVCDGRQQVAANISIAQLAALLVTSMQQAEQQATEPVVVPTETPEPEPAA